VAAGAQEIGVQGVKVAVFDSAAGGDDRLGSDEATEKAALAWTGGAEEEVLVEAVEIEQAEEAAYGMFCLHEKELYVGGWAGGERNGVQIA